jgi:plastocyanin
MASYGAPQASYYPTATGSSSGSYGTGATHTVVVAPTQGVLRFVPFALNASVGDTVMFMWGANNHTVTKSSELTPCNKTGDALFTSGEQNLGFTFTQVVNDTNPVFYYCGTPSHCQKGMFGIINPPNAFGASTSVSGMMQSISANNSDVSAYAAYSTKMTANNEQASKWGSNIDLASLPSWSQSLVAENVLYTRNFLASNSEVLKADGSIDLSAAGSTPLMIPQDISAALNNAASVNPSASASATGSATASATPESSAVGATSKNGATSTAVSRVLVGLTVAAGVLFAL